MKARTTAARSSWLAAGLIVGMAVLGTGCSLVVDTDKAQCQVDDDCLSFDAGGHPLCQKGVCVNAGLGPAGCFYGTPTSESDLINQCTTGKCLPFDNCARIELCGGAALPATIDSPPGGGG